MTWTEYRKTAHVQAIPLPDPGNPDLPSPLRELRADGRIMVESGGGAWIVLTDEGALHAGLGDYLLRDPETGAIWPVERETFARTYEEVAE